MKNKKTNKRIVTLLLALSMAVSTLAGCGRGEKAGQEEETAQKEFVYVPEYQELDFGITGGEMNVNRTVVSGDDLYMLVSAWDEENGSSYGLYKYNMAEETMSNIPLEMGENDWPGQMCIAPDGNVAVVVSSTTYDLDDNGEPINYQETIELRILSGQDGSVVRSEDLTQVMGSENPYVQYFCADAKGNYYIGSSGEQQDIIVVSPELQKIATISMDGWINSMVVSKEGDVYVSSYGDTGLELKKVDLESKSLGAKLEGFPESYGNVEYYTGGSKSILYSGEKVILYDVPSGEQEELFAWLDVDVNNNYIRSAGELSDGRIWAVYEDYETENSETELLIVKKEKAENVTPKEEITYGTVGLDWDVKRMIINFNKSSEKYRIVVKDYYQDGDYQTSLTQFNADLTGGNCPDLINLASMNYTQYAAKGIFENLYPYMEKSGLKKEDYLENILNAFELNGNLYAIVPGFYVTTTMAKQSVVGDIQGWTLSEMLDFVEKNDPENIFSYGSRESIFYYCIYNNIDEFIDWETGKCAFDGEDFIRTLEFAAKFPSSEEINYSGEQEGTYAQLQADKILLMQAGINSVQQFQMYMGMFGEKVAFVGYPNSERKGNLIQPIGGWTGISAKSKHKEGGWEFLSSMLEEEYQKSNYIDWGFPVMKSALEEKFEEDMTPEYYEDENGEKVEREKTSWGYDDFNMDIYAATQEEIDTVRALLESAEKISENADEQLMNIITEESAAFFQGQKSAADTAAVIQNRIQIYVNENQ